MISFIRLNEDDIEDLDIDEDDESDGYYVYRQKLTLKSIIYNILSITKKSIEKINHFKKNNISKDFIERKINNLYNVILEIESRIKSNYLRICVLLLKYPIDLTSSTIITKLISINVDQINQINYTYINNLDNNNTIKINDTLKNRLHSIKSLNHLLDPMEGMINCFTKLNTKLIGRSIKINKPDEVIFSGQYSISVISIYNSEIIRILNFCNPIYKLSKFLSDHSIFHILVASPMIFTNTTLKSKKNKNFFPEVIQDLIEELYQFYNEIKIFTLLCRGVNISFGYNDGKSIISKLFIENIFDFIDICCNLETIQDDNSDPTSNIVKSILYKFLTNFNLVGIEQINYDELNGCLEMLKIFIKHLEDTKTTLVTDLDKFNYFFYNIKTKKYYGYNGKIFINSSEIVEIIKEPTIILILKNIGKRSIDKNDIRNLIKIKKEQKDPIHQTVIQILYNYKYYFLSSNGNYYGYNGNNIIHQGQLIEINNENSMLNDLLKIKFGRIAIDTNTKNNFKSSVISILGSNIKCLSDIKNLLERVYNALTFYRTNFSETISKIMKAQESAKDMISIAFGY